VQQVAARLFDAFKRGANAVAQNRHAAFRKHFGPVTGDTDGQDERDGRRTRLPSRICCLSCAR
jgi:hypothetical protein